MIKKTCKDCGSEDLLFDAWARWDYATQENILVDVYPKAICQSCGGQCTVNEIQTDEKENTNT